jgi:Zn-dependent peptidase ImmA (M78 family)
MRTKDVIQKAKDFCIENSVTDYPVNIVGLCEQRNISVFETYLPEDVSGFIVIQKDNYKHYGTNRVIVVNLSDSASRRRFTIAHELAHFILHRKEEDPLYAHRDAGQNSRIEQEANIFASNILMPEDLVLDAIEHSEYSDLNIISPEYIAQAFAVSRSAAEVRLKQLGIR